MTAATSAASSGALLWDSSVSSKSKYELAPSLPRHSAGERGCTEQLSAERPRASPGDCEAHCSGRPHAIAAGLDQGPPGAAATLDTRRRAAGGVPGMAAAATAPRKQLAELVLVVLLASLSICLIGHSFF